jgi:hypothetical protein
MVKDRAAGAVSRCDLAVIAKFLDRCPTKREPREQAASAIAVHPLVQRPATAVGGVGSVLTTQPDGRT